MPIRHLSHRTLTWLLLFLALTLRLAVSSHFLLAPDEANYWQWSRHLALGYHDHPPMIAWAIALATSLFGHTEWAVRLPTILGLTLASSFLCLLAARWFSWRVAFHTGLVCELLLLTNGSALIATPDGLLLPCWAAACYHAAVAVESDRRGHWLTTGLWFGLGLLCKYTMLLFPASLGLTLLASADHRRRLLAPWPWLGLLLGLLLFTPVLVWNAQHDWATFRHVLYQGGADSRTFFTLRFVGDYFASQAALLTPLVFLLVLAAWFRPGLWSRLEAGRAALLVGLSLPGFLVFLLLSLHVRIYGNWPAPVYLSALVLIAALFSRRAGDDGHLTGVWKAALVTAAAITLPVIVQVVYPVLPLPLRLDRTARECAGWDQLGAQVGAAAKAMERPDRTFLFGLRYQYASELAFYTPGQPQTVSINRWTRPNVYDYWFEDRQLVGWDGVGILEDPATAAAVSTLFTRSLPVEPIILHRDSPWFGRQAVQTLYLFRGYGFRGGLRWQPQDAHDIRAGRDRTAGARTRVGR